MLNINKSITLNATSDIDGAQVAYMSATVNSENGSANISKSITNQALYSANKAEVRKDMAAFEEEVHKIEDEMLNSNNEV